MHTTFDNSLLLDGPVQRKLWYVSDRRIRTPAAARHAAELGEWATTNQGSDAGPDEYALFTALHICAYRTARCAQGNGLAAAERAEWSKRWQHIREHIVQRNLGLAHFIGARFNSRGLDEDEVLSEALLGLARAVDRFNPWKGWRFSTYACNVIARALVRRGRREQRRRQIFAYQFDPALEKPVLTEDHQAELGLDAERLQRVLKGNLGHLTKLESQVLTRRFPSDDRGKLTFQQIGDMVGLSKERVRQIQNVALTKLRTILELDPVPR